METSVLALPIQLLTSGQQLAICFSLLAGDGANPPFSLPELNFPWDLTQPVANNIANLKAAIVSEAAASGVNITSSSVNVLMAVS